MLELCISVIIALLLGSCLGVLIHGSRRCGGCCGIYGKDELMEILGSIPDGSRIYISFDKRQD